MSLAVPAIRQNLKFEYDNTTVNLNELNDGYNEIYTYTGFGIFISAFFRLSKASACVLVEIDGQTVTEIDIETLPSIASADSYADVLPIRYDNTDRVLSINFGSPVNFSRSLRLLFKRNSNGGGQNKAVELEAYAVTLTKEGA